MTVRTGKVGDLPRVLELIKELAEYENGLDQVSNTVELMEKDGFGARPLYGLIVAEEPSGRLVGLSIYYYRYSTWKGKRLYLEDIVVTTSERGKGVGAMLFERTLQQCLESGCSGMMWQVLNWNEPALNFYRKYEAKLDASWVNGSLEADVIKALLSRSSDFDPNDGPGGYGKRSP